MKTGFIFETGRAVQDMKLSKSEGDGLLTLSGVFGECGVRNRNNRVYEKSNYGSMIQELQKRIQENGGVPGTLEHENTMYVTLENISHKITAIQMDENGLVTGTIKLLNTPKGKIAQAIVEGGLPLFISSRASGSVDKAGNVKLDRLECYDLVGTPGFANAKLHLNESQIMESLGDNCYMVVEKEDPANPEPEPITKAQKVEENDEDNDMTHEDFENKLSDLQERIQELENQKSNLPRLEELADGIQNWCINEFASGVQDWIEKEFKPEVQAETIKECKNLLIEKMAPAIEKWICEEYSPELEKWICEEYSPEVENWVTQKVAPGIQEWIIESFSPELEKWITECYGENVKNMIAESMEGNKESKLQSIKDTLSMLESIQVQKPSYGRVITESQTPEPLYIQNMPEETRVKYNMASQEVKESISRRARLFDFSKEGAIERFWENISFEDIKPATNIYEGLDKITDQREREIRAAFRRHRNPLG